FGNPLDGTANFSAPRPSMGEHLNASSVEKHRRTSTSSPTWPRCVNGATFLGITGHKHISHRRQHIRATRVWFFVSVRIKGGVIPAAGWRPSTPRDRLGDLGPCSGGNKHRKIGKKLANTATVLSLEPKADVAETEPATVAVRPNPRRALSGHGL